MTHLEKIEREIAELAPQELARFRAWFAKFDAANWDAEIEADVTSGRLDNLAERALSAHRAGKSKRGQISTGLSKNSLSLLTIPYSPFTFPSLPIIRSSSR